MKPSTRKQIKKGLIKIILAFSIGVILYSMGGIKLMAFYMLFLISLLLAAGSSWEKGLNKIVKILDENKMIPDSDFWKGEDEDKKD